MRRARQLASGLQILVCLCVFFGRLPSVKADSGNPSNSTEPALLAVQTRPYRLTNEFFVGLGYLPLDSFNNYVSLTGSYTHFYNDFMGWEIANLSSVMNVPTGLTSTLGNTWDAASIPYPVLQYYGSTNFIYTPFYTKNLIFNSSTAFGETSLVGGFGVAKFDAGNSPLFDFGVIFRYVLNESFFIKFDAREFLFPSSAMRNNMSFTLGVAFNTGGKIEMTSGSSDDD